MNFELEKCIGIITATINYCHSHGAHDFDIKLKQNEDRLTTIIISCEVADLSEETLEYIVKRVTTHRQHEVEESYWGLSIESEFGDELMLVGIMTDEASVEYENNILRIELKRKE